MKALFLASAAALAFTGAALAEGPAGQTFSVAAGEESWTVTFYEDGVYESERTGEGEWSYAEGELCLTGPAAEGEPPATTCAAWTDLEVGASLTTAAWSEDGSEITITRVE